MIMVRVNDRGPFAKDRIIDLSKKSATLLGFKEKGTAKVKVELLPDETNELLAQLNIKK
jgi:rare lipoprotein A